MAKAQKFGTFGGVFVPSILTILGVIMYLRLGWVVGEAGLIGTILIILLAHVVSVCTGLSVSSVATDQKVKAGGVYYMLSRSLGLPIGGSIGVALYVATALSIAMYVVGFSESFNGFIGITTIETSPEEQINNLRITGSITLIVITSLALISTSLAIKTQYYILAAIVLSLISIFAGGLFMDHGLDVTTVKMFPGEGSASLEYIFAIFFPAVTGFTAGVAMSGDLKDPKKSIPLGTMLSITVGLVVYIILAIFLSTTIDSGELSKDYTILSRISLLAAYGSPFVLAGIWGATLSSALGGILGGPRVLQAMSMDKVTPKLFGTGVGKSNEPRNALILTFFIAEGGILIGALDIIAPIVSMFYLTAYGFINLSSTLESWSGSNFRPTFKIPKVVSIIGAIATFSIMFKLDLVSMIASFFAMGIIFIILTRRQINLGYGDVWQGVWSELIRTALFKVDQKTIDSKSWRPNILLFSGGTEKRPHLIEYGRKIVGRLGLLSNFDLIENPELNLQFSKTSTATESTQQSKGIFSRSYQCKNIYSGIESIAETYGFSGIEPNTILMGWARLSPNPDKFVSLLDKFVQLDHNLLIMDYDQRVGFGDRLAIDIWWNGTGNNASFPLTVNRFLLTTDDWYKAKIRLFIYADLTTADLAKIQYSMDQLVEDLKINASINLVDLKGENRPLNEIIQHTSKETDLIYLDLPPLNSDTIQHFFTSTDILCKEIGTVVLYHASSHFKDINLDLNDLLVEKSLIMEENELDQTSLKPKQHLDLPAQENAAVLIGKIDDVLQKNNQLIGHDLAGAITGNYFQLLNQLKSTTQTYFHPQKSIPANTRKENEFEQSLTFKESFFQQIESVIEQRIESDLEAKTNLILKKLADVDGQQMEFSRQFGKFSRIKFSKKEALKNLSVFPPIQRLFAKISDKPVTYKLNNRKLISNHLQQQFKNHLLDYVSLINGLGTQFNKDLKNAMQELVKADREHALENSPNSLLSLENQITEKLSKIENDLHNNINKAKANLNQKSFNSLQKSVYDLAGLKLNTLLNSEVKSKALLNQQSETLNENISTALQQQNLLLANTLLDIKLLSFQNEILSQFDHLASSGNVNGNSISSKIHSSIEKINLLKETVKSNAIVNSLELTDESNTYFYKEHFDNFQDGIKQVLNELPDQYMIGDPKSLMNENSEDISAVSISPIKTIDYIVSENLIKPLATKNDRLQLMVDQTINIEADVTRVIGFTLDNYQEKAVATKDPQQKEEIVQTISEETERLTAQVITLEKEIENYNKDIVESKKMVLGKLDGYAVIKSALDLNYILREQRKQEAIGKFASFKKAIKNKLQDVATNFYYRKSEGILAAKKINEQKGELVSTQDFLQLVAQLSPKKKVLEKLPLYYKQLFFQGQMNDKELRVIRNTDQQLIEEVSEFYDGIQSGAILITGAPGSGKSLLSKMMAEKLCNPNNIYIVDGPPTGSIEVPLFDQSVKKEMKHYGDFNHLFDNIDEKSAIVFNDVELWWERSEQGYRVLERIMEMIDLYSQKCLFIFNMNKYSFEFVNQLISFGDSFIKVIDIEPHNIEQLKEAILKRHRTSRLKFSMDNVAEDKMGNLELARVFSQIFNVSKGNIGTALQLWVSSMEEISEDREIKMKVNKQVVLDILKDLDEDKTIILIQIILHKALTTDRLKKITKMDVKSVNREINWLKRAGILEITNGRITINPFLEFQLTEVLKDESII